jgi:hypothetical protein
MVCRKRSIDVFIATASSRIFPDEDLAMGLDVKLGLVSDESMNPPLFATRAPRS